MSDKAQILGEAAHIKSASPGGARYEPGQSEEERHGIENGIWLCERCASLVDKNGGADFSVAELLLWKRAAERSALERIYRHSDVVRDNCVSTLIFINVPRLSHYVALTGQSPIPMDFAAGIPGDGYIIHELHALERVIAGLRFPASDWVEAVSAVYDPTGMLVSFEGRFRTKNGSKGRDDRAPRDLSDLSVAPHVYQRVGPLRLVLPYDPKFLTTSTAGVEMCAGQVRIGGFAQIKFRDGDDVIASPLIIGLASTPEVRAFWDAMRRN